MRRFSTFQDAITPSQAVLLAILFLAVGLIGCDNSCFVFVSNPGGTVSSGTNPCSLNQTNGNVRTQITTSRTQPAGDEPATIQHIFVTLRGIEANPSATAGEDSPGWQELAPKLLTQPAQLDLIASSGDSHELDVLGDATVPADAYRQIRLRLSSNQIGPDDSVSRENSCGNVGLNCIVTLDGLVRPLVLDTGLSQMQVSSDRIAGGFFRIFPETNVDLKIEFNPQSSLFIPTNEAVRFVPAFTADSQTLGESASIDQ
jgi:hypothetical protein